MRAPTRYGIASFAVSFLLGLFYVVRMAECHACNAHASTFYTTSPGTIFSILQVLHGILSTIWYVKAIAAVRRLARSSYYMHPDIAYQTELARRDLARRHAAVTPAPLPRGSIR